MVKEINQRLINLNEILFPSVLEGSTWSNKNILELAFFYLTDGFRKLFHKEKQIEFKTFFDKSIDALIIFFILLVFITPFLLLPFIITAPDDPSKIKVLFVIGLYLFFASISWTGFVYLSAKFKDLVRTKILPVNQDSNISSQLSCFINQFFNGSSIELGPGRTFRFYWRSFFLLLIVISADQTTIIPIFINQIIPQLTFEWMAFIMVLAFLTTIILISLMLFIIFYILTTIILIFFFLLFTVRSVSLDINPFIERGGTEEFGKIIVFWLYLFGFSVGIFPFIKITPAGIDFAKFSMTQISYSMIQNQTVGSIFTSIKNTSIGTISEIPIIALSEYFWIFFVFIILIFMSFVIVYILHTRIKQVKNEGLSRLEGMITHIDFFSTYDPINRDRNQYLLCLYEKISNLKEWPIGRFFIFEVLISVLLLSISQIFS